MPAIRHWCDQGDGLRSYGWVQHDGRSFGRQTLEDKTQSIETSFVKVSGLALSGQLQLLREVLIEKTLASSVSPLSCTQMAPKRTKIAS